MFQRRLLLFFLGITHIVSAQGWRPVGARSSALAGASVCLSDVWAYHHNPGSLAGVHHFTAGIYYEARFLAKELQTQSVTAAMPLRKGVISVGMQRYGYSQYTHTRTGAGYALQLAEFIAAGIQINLQQLRFGGNYGSAASATTEAGILARVSDNWKFGVSVLNIGRQRILPLENDRFGTVMRLGASYSPSQKVHILGEVEKQVVFPVAFRGAMEYLPADHLVVRGGIQAGPTEFAFGIGYRKSGFLLDAGSKYHPVLGWTPNVGFTYQPDDAR